MGGVPYTSLGCVNCRKRKIKCDLEKPECKRCEKSRIRCLGYDRERTIFLPHKLKAQRKSTGEVLQPVRHNVTHSRPLAVPSFFNINTCAENRTQLVSNFMGDFFVPNAKAQDDVMYFVMAQSPIRAGQSELLDRSVMALVAAFLGRANNDKALVIQGMKLYHTALNFMRLTLQRNRSLQDRQEGANMLCSTVVLNTYESIHGNYDAIRGFLAHVKGATAIMKQYNLTGGDADALTKRIHVRQKWAAAYFILSTEYGSEIDLECLFLRQDDSIEDELLGIIGECALLQRTLDGIFSSQGIDRRDSYKDLLRRCFQLQDRLRTEFLDGSGHIQALDDRPIACERNELKTEPHLQWLDTDLLPYRFKHTQTALIYILYWVAMLVTERIRHQTQLGLSRETNISCALLYASEICRSVVYWMQPERSISFNGPMVFAVSQASECFIQCGMKREFLWCQGVYYSVQQSGYGFMAAVSEREVALWNRTWEQESIPQGMVLEEKAPANIESMSTSSPSSALPVRSTYQ